MDNDEIGELLADYLPKLAKLSKYNLDQKFHAKFDPDDIAASVIRTVFRRIQEEKFQFEDDESLWKQLVTITLRRISNRIRDSRAKKRGGGQNSLPLDELQLAVAKEPAPEHAEELVEVMGLLSKQLDEVGMKVIELRMANFTYAEIAEELNVSEKTVSRKLMRAKEVLEQLDLEQ
ncbi:MAG: sigma-70 family RNA polymerase sigma factor [Planctomycetota bacterium]